MTKFELHIPISEFQQNCSSVIQQASKEFQSLSIGQIKTAIQKGALWLTRDNSTQRLRKVKKELKINDTIHFYYDESILSQQAQDAKVIADFHHYSVLYKPSGMMCQGSKWSDHTTITRWAETNLLPQRPAFIVHRLDKAASGLIIVAHSKKAAKAFSAMFEQRKITKQYQIIVHGRFSNESQHISTNVDDKLASSTFTLNEYLSTPELSLIDVNIDTGRKHQIRIHAASINFPVVGDRLHGNAERDFPLNLQLTAVNLSFECPFSLAPKNVTLPTALKPNLNAVATVLQGL